MAQAHGASEVLTVQWDLEALRPLVYAIVSEVLDQRTDDERRLPAERLAHSEAEAASLLGVQRHVLRDARRRGELSGSRAGRGIVYTPGELRRWLEASREGGR